MLLYGENIQSYVLFSDSCKNTNLTVKSFYIGPRHFINFFKLKKSYKNNKPKMPSSDPLPPKESVLFRKILVSCGPMS